MEIKIDTKKDSKEDIQHMIDFLTRFISLQGMTQTTNNEQNDMSVSDGLFGMFGEEQERKEPQQREEENFSIEPY